MAGTSPAMTMWEVGDGQEIQTGLQWDKPGHDGMEIVHQHTRISGTGH